MILFIICKVVHHGAVNCRISLFGLRFGQKNRWSSGTENIKLRSTHPDFMALLVMVVVKCMPLVPMEQYTHCLLSGWNQRLRNDWPLHGLNLKGRL